MNSFISFWTKNMRNKKIWNLFESFKQIRCQDIDYKHQFLSATSYTMI